jgi:hypothetical protein
LLNLSPAFSGAEHNSFPIRIAAEIKTDWVSVNPQFMSSATEVEGVIVEAIFRAFAMVRP